MWKIHYKDPERSRNQAFSKNNSLINLYQNKSKLYNNYLPFFFLYLVFMYITGSTTKK